MAFFRFNLQSHPCTTHPPGVNVWIVVRNSPFSIDIHKPLWKNPTLHSRLWYKALVRWRHNRRPRNSRFIQWSWKTDAKKVTSRTNFERMLSRDFYWVIEDYFSLRLLRIGRHGFSHRSAALRWLEIVSGDLDRYKPESAISSCMSSIITIFGTSHRHNLKSRIPYDCDNIGYYDDATSP